MCSCRVGIDIPTVEVRCENLTMEAKVTVGSRALPTVLNSYRNFFEVSLLALSTTQAMPRVCLTHLCAIVAKASCLFCKLQVA